MFTKTAPQSHLQSGSRKLRLKVATRSCCPKLLPQSCNLSNLYTKTAPQSYSAKRLPKAAPESCYWKLLPEVVCKAAPERCCSSKQLFLKVAPDSLPKLLPKAAVQSYCPKAAILQIYTLKRLPKAILQSGSRKLLPKVATESCSPKWFVYRQIVILVVINWGHAVIDCGLQFLGCNSEQPCGLHWGHRRRVNMTKCVAIWKYATGLVV